MPSEEVGKKIKGPRSQKNHHRDLQKIIKKINHDLKKSKPHFSHIDPLFRLRVKNLAFSPTLKNPLKPQLNQIYHRNQHSISKTLNLNSPIASHPFLTTTTKPT